MFFFQSLYMSPLYANYMPTDIGCLKAGFAFYTYKVMIIFGELFHPQWVNESNSEDSSFLISFLDLFLYLHFWNYIVLVNVLWSITRFFSCPWLVLRLLRLNLFRPILCTLLNSDLILTLACHSIPVALPYTVDYLLQVFCDKANVPSQDGHVGSESCRVLPLISATP